jgi:hypothetical protein
MKYMSMHLDGAHVFPGAVFFYPLLLFLPMMKTISFSFLRSGCIFYSRDDDL